MIFSEIRMAANPPGAVPLGRDQIWRGLRQKAEDAVPYVAPITRCTVIDRIAEDVFDREVELGGQRYVERVFLEAPNKVVFARLEGPVLGTITNDILEEDGELGLRFQFALTVRPGHTIPITEEELAEQMVSAYRTAVETTLAAVRSDLAAAEGSR